MHEVAKLVPSRRPVAGAPQDWSRLMAALELLFVAVDSHADDLKALLQIVNPRLAPKTAKQSASQIDDVFEELVGRPFNRMRHHGENLEARICYSNQFSLYGYL